MSKYIRTKDRREFVDSAISGLKFYVLEKKVPVAHMILSQPEGSKKDLFRMFELLIPRMLNYSKYGRYLRIDFNMAMVNNQHMHILIKKPYSPVSYLKRQWDGIVGVQSDFYIRAVRPSIVDIERISMYISQQAEHEGHTNVSFIRNTPWGTMTKREKQNIHPIKIPDKIPPSLEELKNIVRGPDGSWVIKGDLNV